MEKVGRYFENVERVRPGPDDDVLTGLYKSDVFFFLKVSGRRQA